ncbi:MAG: PAS domain S-box protein, partial [Chloroflexi bacterium]|nr:PAS domain S-box protein [Chloroflexota bacterium]
MITKHNGAKQALPESEDRYRALFDHSPDAVYIHDLEGNFLDANDAALRLLGYTRDEIRELSFADLLDVPQFPTALAVLQEIMESGYQAKPTVFKLKRKDETLVEVETVAAIITSEGQPVAIQGIARDITERRQAEKALRKAHDALERRAEETLQKSEGRYHALLQAAPDAIVVANGDGRITEVNRQTEMMFGYGRDELVDEPVELLIPERHRQAHVGHRKVYAANPRTRAMGAYPDQLTGRRKDG